jgi:hypothetical protein
MVLVTGNFRLWLIGMAASLAIFAVVFFTVIKPSTDTANQAVKNGLQQTSRLLNQTGGAGSQALGAAQKLEACIAAAGTDTTKLANCQSQFGH